VTVGGEIRNERDSEGDDGGDQVVGVSLVDRDREDDQVEHVARGAHDREAGHLTQPVR
jgi:hypothetical protein